MARRRVKKNVKQKIEASPGPSNCVDGNNEEPQIEEKEMPLPLIDQEVERQSAAIRAMRDVEIEHMLTGLRLLRSYFNEEQLQAPALQFFKENLPNLSVVENGENGQFELQWNDKDGNFSMNKVTDVRDIHASILRRLSLAYPDFSAVPSLGGFELSSDAVRTSLLDVDKLQIRNFALEGPSDSLMLGMQDVLRTPGVSSQRLSIGMTPKTLRFPKPGEMLLSVRGSPLGVYKEENMEAIHEAEEG